MQMHNHMNENTSKTFLQWESLNNYEGGSDDDDNKNKFAPKLLKFQCRPMNLSPIVSFEYYVLGHPLPFDRNDWHVETNTNLKRQIIDYYHQEESS